jgi:hypothetical protein
MPMILPQDEGPSAASGVNSSTVAFAKMGIDIVGKLTPTQGNYTFVVIVVEYCTKWIEAKWLTNMSSATIKKFFW